MEEVSRQRDCMRDIMDRWHYVNESAAFARLKDKDALALPDEVLAPIFRFVKASTLKEWQEHTSRKAFTLLHHYENKERLSLLYLAVWKEECLAQMPIAHTLSCARQWIASGWKKCKLEQSNCNAMSIIASLVHPFLPVG
jgi:hypothetical protein